MQTRERTFDAIGTRWTIQCQSEISDAAWQNITAAIDTGIEKFDTAYSRFRSDSLVAAMARNAGTFAVPADAHALLSFYEQLYSATGGSVTPLIGQTVSDAGYDAQYSLKVKAMSAPPRWEDTLSFTTRDITLTRPALLDFGAAGKGYLVDIVGELLAQAGLDNYLINAGGDILHRRNDTRELRVGLENPLDTSEVVGVVTIRNQSLCASSGARRAWGNYTHIINPHTQKSPTDVLATWVIANDTMTADGLATALFFSDAATLQKQFNFECAVLSSSMKLERSKNFPAEIFEAAQ